MNGITTDLSNIHLSKFLYGCANVFSLPMERNFTPQATVEWASNNWAVVVSIIVIYMTLIFGGRKLMENQKPFVLQMPLAAWNGFLCVFSFIGMCRTVSYLINHLFQNILLT